MRCNELMTYRYVYLSVYLHVYLSVHNCIFDFRFSWYLDTIIIRWGTIGGPGIWGQGHLGVIWGRCSNMLKTLLHLHDSIDFDETWVKRFRVFKNFWSEVILGSFGVTVERSNFKQSFTTKLTMSMCWFKSSIKKCSWWPLRLTCG